MSAVSISDTVVRFTAVCRSRVWLWGECEFLRVCIFSPQRVQCQLHQGLWQPGELFLVLWDVKRTVALSYWQDWVMLRLVVPIVVALGPCDVDQLFLRACWESETGKLVLGPLLPTASVPGQGDVNSLWSYRMTAKYAGDFALVGMVLERWNAGRSHQVDSSVFE